MMKRLILLLAPCSLLLLVAPLRGETLAGDLVVQKSTKFTGIVTPAAITSSQNNYNPTSLATVTILRLSSDASRTITGLQGGAAGRVLTVCNVGSFPIVLADESSSSTAAYRFALAGDFTLAADTAVQLVYDGTSSRWRLTSPQGTVSSVTLTVPTGFSVSGSPITSSGTFAISTTLSGVLKGNGSGFVVATGGSDYENPLTFSAPLSRSTNAISITNAAADGTTKGAAAFTAADFNASSGVISLDYANGQAATGSVNGFLSSSDWATFNGKLSTPGSSAQGDIEYYNGSIWTRLPRGTNGQVLKSTSTTINWDTDATGSGSLPGSPAAGDLAYYNGSAWVSLTIGTASQVLKVNAGATAPEWAAAGGGGDSAATSTSTGTQNDFSFSGATVLYMNNASATTITGLSAGTDGQRLTIVSKGAGQVNLTNQDAGSTAANRIINQVTATISLAAGVGRAILVYDSTTARWRVVEHEQGAPIDVAYSSGDYTGSGSITWTVASGDLVRYAYLLRGQVMQVWVMIEGSSVSGTGSELRIAIPAGVTPVKPINSAIFGGNNSSQYAGFANVAVSATTIKCYNTLSGANWSSATDATSVYIALAFQVQ